MNSKQKMKPLLILSSILLFTLLTFGGASSAPISESSESVLIEYLEDGFSVQTVTVPVGTTITWRNSTNTTLNLRGNSLQNTIYLPFIMSGNPNTTMQQTEMRSSTSGPPANGFEAVIAPGDEFSYQINTTGRFQFMDLTAPNVRGHIIVTPLTQIYRGDDGSVLYLRTVGNTVYGFGEHPGLAYAYALNGLLGDNHISATFWDIPKGTRMNEGDVLLNVSHGGTQLSLESGSAAIGTDTWEAIAPGSFDWPPGLQPAGFQETVLDDLTGAFEADDGSRYYIREAGDQIVWVSEAAAQPGERPAWVNVFIGERDAQVLPGVGGSPVPVDMAGSFADVPKGLRNVAGTFGAAIHDDRTLDMVWAWVSQIYNVEPDYAVDWDLFESGIRDALDNKAVGYAYAIGKGQGLMRSGADGYRLLAQDGGLEPFTVHTQAQAFSTSKTMTAVALVKALHENGLTVDDYIHPYLPDCWTPGAGVEDLQFWQLLDHSSGLGQPNGGTLYLTLKKLIEDGVVGPQTPNYNNTVYGFMRYLIPFVNNENTVHTIFSSYDCENDSAAINNALSTLFSDYLFDMLDEVDVDATFFKDDYPNDPTQVDVAYLYNRNFEQFPGLGPNEDGWLRAGAGYVATSVTDYRRFLGALDRGQILPHSLVENMYNGNLGFDGPAQGAAGLYYTKNGANTGACGAGGLAQLMIYPSGINAYIMINSATDGNSANWYYDYNYNAGTPDDVVSDWGLSGDLPIAGDFDRDDQIDDVAVYRPSTQTWYYDYNHNGGAPNEEVANWGLSGDLPIAGDFDRDGRLDDVAVFRPSNQTWYYDYDHNGSTDEEVAGWGASGDLPIAGDFDIDGDVDDVAVFRPSTQTWYYDYDHNGNNDTQVSGWGASGDLPIAGDFDRNIRVNDIAVFRPSTQTWYYDYNHNGGTNEEVSDWGASGDLPIAGDFDGDGRLDDVAVFRPSTQTWYYDYDHEGDVSTDEVVYSWGLSGDLPIAGDFDGDGRLDDTAVYRPSTQTWYYDYDHDDSVPSDEVVSGWGASGDLPIAGDFDRDGQVDDVAVYRPSNQTWYYDYDHDGSAPPDEVVSGWGLSGDIPIAGDFDRDGQIDDVAVYRPSNQTWYYDYNHNGSTNEEVSGWGNECDIPIAGDFDRDGRLDDVAIYRPSTSDWYYDFNHNGNTNEQVFNWGNGSDIPLVGDFDSDGQVDDVAIFRNTGLSLRNVLETAFDNALR